MPVSRLVAVEDASALAELAVVNRDFLAPYEPVRPDDHYTEAGQRQLIESLLESNELGTTHPRVILDGGEVVGRITLSQIVRGPAQSCSLGYWIGESHNGRGLATAAVREVLELSFGPLELHRVQAGTMLDNLRSQRVLERCGFTRFGMSPAYVKIAGRWQDHYLYQLLNPADL